MKKFPPIGLLTVLVLTIALAGCGGAPPSPLPFPIAESLVPGAVSFPTGTNDAGVCTEVNYPYYMARYEVTYALWDDVATWARRNGYTFNADSGRRGAGWNQTKGEEIFFDRGHESDPVTHVTWYDAVVWCNALTECYNERNRTDLDCVYKDEDTLVIRDSTNAAVKEYLSEGPNIFDTAATGFRLPTSMEWELAARYRGKDSTNMAGGYDNPCFTKGNSASGAVGPYTDGDATKDAAWYVDNCKFSSNPDLYSTQPVGQKPEGGNALGLYDMSGNVLEWCFDKQGSMRVFRGGSWLNGTINLQIGFVSSYSPDAGQELIGFRIARIK